MDLETRVKELESRLNALVEVVNGLQAEKMAQKRRVAKATDRALLHSEDCTCTACLIYQINKEL